VTDIEGVGNLAELAVADAVNPGSDLLPDHVVDSGGETGIEGHLI
jgi:hypothetical protein